MKKNNYIRMVFCHVVCLIDHIHDLKYKGKEVQGWNACTNKDHNHFNKILCWIFIDRMFFLIPT